VAEAEAISLLKARQQTLMAIRNRLLDVETITGEDLKLIATPART
jgi:ATP-dependent Zn protease